MTLLSLRCTLMFLLTALAGYSQRHDSLKLHQATIHYYTYGQGNPVLLLSGGPGIAGRQEDDLARLVAVKHQAIIMDQRGTGNSLTQPMDASTINLKRATADIDSLRQHLGLEQIAISGHSWGAMLATAYAAAYPHRVKGLLLIGGGELDVALTDVVNANVDKRFQLGDTVILNYWARPENAKRAPDSVQWAQRRLGWKSLIYDEKKLDAVLAQAEHGSMNKGMSDLMWTHLRSTRFNMIDSVKKAYKGLAIIALGWQDPIAITTLHQYVQAYPQATIRGIPNCGHMPATEQPERMARIADEFMRKTFAAK